MFSDLPSDFVKFNRPVLQSQERSGCLHKIYESLFDAPILSRAKYRAFEMAADDKDAWRVAAISTNAARLIAQQESLSGIVRGHPVARSKRGEMLFSHGKLSESELIDIFFTYDTVALVTKAENTRHGFAHWSGLHPVDAGLFTKGGAGFSLQPTVDDFRWTKQLVIGIAEKTNESPG